MKYYTQNGVHIIQCTTNEFSIGIYDQPKKSPLKSLVTSTNAGFFANYKEDNTKFTLPVGHIIADMHCNALPRYYLTSWGKEKNGKVYFDSYDSTSATQFYKKELTCFIVNNGITSIQDVKHIDPNWNYCIAGIPIMKDGKDVKWSTYVCKQGWTGGELYATKHVFIGLKKNDANIYIMGWKSKSGNMIASGEAYKLFSSLGFYSVIKLDGGGSYYFHVNGTTVDATSENRRINSYLVITGAQENRNPYNTPYTTLKQGSKNVSGVKWLQWQLNYKGYTCAVDGSFGPNTTTSLKKFQADSGLVADGCCGPKTRTALQK